MKTTTMQVDYYGTPPGEKERRWTHAYTEEWRESGLFCPNCGTCGSVWSETGGGDYYVGNEHICTACESRFFLPDGVSPAANEQDKQRLGVLKKQ